MIEDVVEEPAELQQEVVFIEEDEEEPTKETKKEVCLVQSIIIRTLNCPK